MKYLHSINGLRAISIILVILHHLVIKQRFLGEFHDNDLFFLFQEFLTNGQLGVNIFFIISGFLITSLLIHEEEKEGEISIRKFYVRRILRIFPAYYTLLLVYFILQFFGKIHLSNLSWFTALTYLKDFRAHEDWLTAHAWSLSIEEQFYLVWPFIFLYLKKIRTYILFILVIAVLFFRVYLILHPIFYVDHLTIYTRIDGIAMGCLLAFYKKQILQMIQRKLKPLFYFSILGLCILSMLPHLHEMYPIQLPIFIVFNYPAFGFLGNIFIVLILLHSIQSSGSLWYKFLNSKIMNSIGLLSYSIYIWQQIFLDQNQLFFSKYPYSLFYLLITSMISYYCIEKPFLRLKKTFTA